MGVIRPVCTCICMCVQVSRTDAGFPGLGAWLTSQKTMLRKGTMLPARRELLEPMGLLADDVAGKAAPTSHTRSPKPQTLSPEP